MSDDLKNAIIFLERHIGDISLISHNLAPNVNGFCYEVYNTYNTVSKKDLSSLDSLLDNLSSKDETALIKLYL